MPCPDPLIPDPPPTAPGGPFTNCGMGPVGYFAPSPTTYPHAFGEHGMLGDSSICFFPFTVQSWWDGYAGIQDALPDIRITDDNRVIHNAAVFPGDVIFEAECIEWVNQTGFGAVTGEYVCAPSADHVTVDGVVVCPEPGIVGALVVGLVALVMGERAKRATRRPR